MKIRRLAATTAIVAMTATLAACGSDDTSSSADTVRGHATRGTCCRHRSGDVERG